MQTRYKIVVLDYFKYSTTKISISLYKKERKIHKHSIQRFQTKINTKCFSPPQYKK